VIRTGFVPSIKSSERFCVDSRPDVSTFCNRRLFESPKIKHSLLCYHYQFYITNWVLYHIINREVSAGSKLVGYKPIAAASGSAQETDCCYIHATSPVIRGEFRFDQNVFVQICEFLWLQIIERWYPKVPPNHRQLRRPAGIPLIKASAGCHILGGRSWAKPFLVDRKWALLFPEVSHPRSKLPCQKLKWEVGIN